MDTETSNQTADDQASGDTQTTAPASAKKELSRWVVEGSIATVTDPDGNSNSFNLAALPQSVIDHLFLVGFKLVVGRADDRTKMFKALEAGELTIRKPAGPKELKLSPWRLAIAHAMVEATKKTDAPLTLDAAKEKASALTKEQVAPAKTDALVVKHFNKLNGAAPNGGGLAGLLAA